MHGCGVEMSVPSMLWRGVLWKGCAVERVCCGEGVLWRRPAVETACCGEGVLWRKNATKGVME